MRVPSSGCHTSAREYFDLEAFEHATLFSDITHVWEAVRPGRIRALIRHVCSEPLTIGDGTTIGDGVTLVYSAEKRILIGRHCVIESGSYIEGPALIGDGVQIRHGAYVRGDVVTGRDCLIGHATEIKNSILLDHSKAPHFAYVGDSILGNRVNLGAGTRCSNLRVFPGTICVRHPDGVIDTGLRKLGAVLGDDVETGCNTVLNPGTLVGRGTAIYPNCTVTGWVPGATVVKVRQDLHFAPREASDVGGEGSIPRSATG